MVLAAYWRLIMLSKHVEGRKVSHYRSGKTTRSVVKVKPRRGRPSIDKIAVEHNGLYAYVRHYLQWMIVKGFSSEANRNRDSHLRMFIQWCDERDIDDPRVVTKPIIERYQRHLYYLRRSNGEPLAFSTQNQRLNCLKAWFKWMTQENYLPSNPASEVIGVRLPQRLPEMVLSVDQVNHILASIDASDELGLRNRAIVEVLYSTGIRRKELCHLLVSDINATRRSVFVRQGKGGKDRCIPISDQGLQWVTRYCDQARPALVMTITEQSLFLNDYGERFTSEQVGQLVKRLLRQAGIDCNGSCHLFRHAMATHMLENGAELRYIQAMLGHTNITTTTIYTHLSIEGLRHVYTATHPNTASDKPITHES